MRQLLLKGLFIFFVMWTALSGLGLREVDEGEVEGEQRIFEILLQRRERELTRDSLRRSGGY